MATELIGLYNICQKQQGIRINRSTMNAIYAVRQVMEKFLDYKKASIHILGELPTRTISTYENNTNYKRPQFRRRNKNKPRKETDMGRVDQSGMR